MAKCCNIDTKGNINNPIPKPSAISPGFSVELVELLFSKLNSQGNCQEGTPSVTLPVIIKAFSFW